MANVQDLQTGASLKDVGMPMNKEESILLCELILGFGFGSLECVGEGVI